MMVGMIVVAVALLSFVLEVTIGSFPYQLFSFPLNILTLILWLILIVYLYGRRKESRLAKFMLSRSATWLSISLMALIGIVLGLQRTPSSTAWPVVVAILFVLTHLAFVILRGWRNSSGIRLRFILTHVGLWLALGAGFWGAPDREQLRVAIDSNAVTKAYTMQGGVRSLPYELRLEKLTVERNDEGVATNFEARVAIDNDVVSLRVNHPYDYSLSQKIYLASVGNADEGDNYAIIEIVEEPWQWLSMFGIVMLILGGVLLFVRGPRKITNGREL
jgi:hypothetical protein